VNAASHVTVSMLHYSAAQAPVVSVVQLSAPQLHSGRFIDAWSVRDDVAE
jgi:hypothetical protein